MVLHAGVGPYGSADVGREVMQGFAHGDWMIIDSNPVLTQSAVERFQRVNLELSPRFSIIFRPSVQRVYEPQGPIQGEFATVFNWPRDRPIRDE